jgi:hypothetical protein
MRFYSDKSPEICKMLLLTNIKECSKTRIFLRPGFSLHNEFIGQVKNDRFWLQKTRRRLYHNSIARVYKGIIFKENKKTVIEGKFCFPFYLILKPLFILLSLILLLTIVNILSSLFGLLQAVYIDIILNFTGLLGVFVILVFLVSWFSVSYFADDENEVIELLHKLFDSSE